MRVALVVSLCFYFADGHDSLDEGVCGTLKRIASQSGLKIPPMPETAKHYRHTELKRKRRHYDAVELVLPGYSSSSSQDHSSDEHGQLNGTSDEHAILHHHHHRHAHGHKRRSKARRGINGRTFSKISYGFGFFATVIRYVEKNNWERCGAAIIAPSWLLTAAHCIQYPNGSIDLSKIVVYTGSTNLLQNIPNHVEAYHILPKSDLILINLDRPLEYTRKAVPIALPRYNEPASALVGRSVCALGYRGKDYEDLDYYNLVLTDRPRCISEEWPNEICSTYERRYGPCYGDSGSPVFEFSASIQEFVLIGILKKTNNDECDPSNDMNRGIYERIGPHLDIIQEFIPKLDREHQKPAEYSLPFEMHLPSRLPNGISVVVGGQFHSDGESFEIDFLTMHRNNFIAPMECTLHIKVHVGEGKVIVSKYKDQQWDKKYEKRISMPFGVGDHFEIRARKTTETVDIMCNNLHLASYRGASDFYKTESIGIKGDAKVTKFEIEGRDYQIPYQVEFSLVNGAGSFVVGTFIELFLVPQGNFKINLLGQNKELLFHLNVRLDEQNPDGWEGVMVRSSRLNLQGAFDEEERAGSNPFEKDHGARVEIYNEQDHLKVIVNGAEAFTFVHRTISPMSDYKGLSITDDVELTVLKLAKPSN